MKIICISGLMLINVMASADTSPRYDFSTGTLTLPFVNTQQGAYSAELVINAKAFDKQPLLFTLTKLVQADANLDNNSSPSFNFTNGLLNIPYISTPQGPYKAALQLQSGIAANAPLLFSLSNVSAYSAPRFNKIQSCTVFPADNVWNTPINSLPVHSRSNAWIASIGIGNRALTMDFGAGLWNGGNIGIPYNVVNSAAVAKSSVFFQVPGESDSGPYPIPGNYQIESGSDHHVVVIDLASCELFELFNVYKSGGWFAGSGAIWKLHSNQLRPSGWTSADAAGLPIFAGLVRYEEVASGFIGHAIRFTVPSSNSYVWPARHLTDGKPHVITDTPPYGARFRLKAAYDISGFAPELQTILNAMKTYGIINADQGGGWFVSGVPDDRWDNELLQKLQVIKGTDFEAVDSACMMVNVNSGQADLSLCQ